MIQIHLVSGHKDIMGNELADQKAKAAAQEMLVKQESAGIPVDKKRSLYRTKTTGG